MSRWTVLIYANGNNELEPEMLDSMLSCERVGSNDDITVVIQLARADRKIAQIMRPNETFPEKTDQWTGVRRYYISKLNSILIQDLGNINMAHPINLHEFIEWGIENYPSEHYMVVLGGHGISFVGNTTDLTQETPYMMGTPEMCKAIELMKDKMDVKIDILVLDMCYMNCIEIIYEFGKSKNNIVLNILTYIGEGPFKGLPYDTLIKLMQRFNDYHNVEQLLKEIINNLNLNTVAVRVNYEELEKIKNKFSDLAYCYLNNNDEKINPLDLLSKSNPTYPWNHMINELNQYLSSIIIHHKQSGNNEKSLIKVICEDIGTLIAVYSKLAFAKNNYWMNLVAGKKVDKEFNNYTEIDLKPMKLSKEGIVYSILSTSPNLTIEQAQSIVHKMFFV